MRFRNQTTIYFIRHGETLSNAKNIQQGVKIDDYLDTQGVLQIQHLGEMVKLLDLDVLFTSYLHRAEETAALINKNIREPVQVLHDFRLRERDFGTLTGKKESDWDALLPDHQQREQMQTYDYRPFGGESVADVRRRAMSAILDITENYDHKNIGIITHAGIIRLLLFHFPDITRLFHAQDRTGKEIANSDIYEWSITPPKITGLRSLLK